MGRALAIWACLAAAPAVADGAEGTVLLAMDGAARALAVWAEDTAHAADGEGHSFTIWAVDGEDRDFEGDVVMVLSVAPDGDGWAATGQLTHLEGRSFHGAILDSDFGAAFAVTELRIEGGAVTLSGLAAGPMGRAQGDTGQNDFSETVPGAAAFSLVLPEGSVLPPPPPD